MSWQTVQSKLIDEKKDEDDKMFGQPAIFQIVSKEKGKREREREIERERLRERD